MSSIVVKFGCSRFWYAEIFCPTVLLNNLSGLGGIEQPVVDQGQRQPGSKNFGDLVHGGRFRSFMLASQAGIQSLGRFEAFSERGHGEKGQAAS
jgi:hypothetical protein